MADYSDYKECTDCAHYELCLYQEKFLIEHNRKDLIRRYGFGLCEPENCCHFQDRSQFVELPCKAGDRLYVIFPKNKHIAEYVVTAFWVEESGTIIRIVDTRFFTVSILLTRDIGTKAFLTKEEAERALKERET